MRRPGAALAVALAVAAALAAASPARAGLTWETVAGVGGDADRDGIVDGAYDSAVFPTRVRLRIELTGGSCPTGAPVALTLDGKALAAQRTGPCAYLTAPVTEGAHRLATRAGDAAPAAGARIAVKDDLVVSIGDSVASGEGNPDVVADLARARWLDRPCHRSMLSGHAQAVREVERSDPRSSVTFVALGCSGATVPEGLLGAYPGIEPDPALAPAPAQVDVLNRIAARDTVDAVLLSIGANDVYFGKIVQFCLFHDRCWTRPFDPANPRALPATGTKPTLDDAVTAALDRLRERYAELNARITTRIPRKRILIVEYFDPTVGPGGDSCRMSIPLLGRIDRRESAWARERVLTRLNAAVADAAERYHWTLVDGVANAFAGHGICATRRGQKWVRTPAASFFRQDARAAASVAGTMHPNRLGHLATAQLIEPRLDAVLEAASPPPLPEPPGGGDDRWFGVRTATLLYAGGALVVLLALAGGVLLRRRPRA